MKKVAKKSKARMPKIVDSAQQIWLAGLGAFSMANEGGKDLFNDLVRRGSDVQKTGRSRVQKLVSQTRKRAASVREDAQAALGRVRIPLDKGMAKAMKRLGVPTRGEILELTKRVEALTKAVEKRNGRTRETREKAPAPAPSA